MTETPGKPLDASATGSIAPLSSFPPVLLPDENSGRLRAGQKFGPYIILSMLGKGGMGEVFEAEHIESGRRVALKVLSQDLATPADRGRFLREGRLAAAISHPNSVYIYGTEEIDGTLVISMELVSGGTLRDLMKKKGPLPIAEAVDYILQVISGLEAAHAKGVLHRDIKPANCFIDTNGVVKVGDFGLSISTLARGETQLTASGAFLGTPAFASPEQLRGDDLDVRADIYSVGVTLYFLLTGKAPFEADHMVKLLAMALEKQPDSPKKLRPEIPKGLAEVILRCLEKQPAARFKNYAELRAALMPFSSIAPNPATLGRRFVAGLIDVPIMMGLGITIFVAFSALDAKNESALHRVLDDLAFNLLFVLYFGLTEGLLGASVGKALAGLRVISADRSSIELRGALWRAGLLAFLPNLGIYAALLVWGFHAYDYGWSSYLFLGSLILIFSTMRRRNGYAAVHDWISGTRVIVPSEQDHRPGLVGSDAAISTSESAQKIGPYHVLAHIDKDAAAEVFLAYDTRLLRKVWLRTLPAGTPPVSAQIRTVSRGGSLRWVNGKRDAGECWDAYEALSGKPLLEFVNAPQRWKAVRHWLLDLAEELNAATRDGTLPQQISLNQIWITGEGQAKLLAFRAPKIPATAAPAPIEMRDFAAAKLLLRQVAVVALEGLACDESHLQKRRVAAPIPLHASEFFDSLDALENYEQLAGALKALLQKPAAVTAGRRSMLTLISIVPPLLLSALLAAAAVWTGEFYNHRLETLAHYLKRVEEIRARPNPGVRDGQRVDAFKVLITGRFKKIFIKNPELWNSPEVDQIISRAHRKLAEEIVAEQPEPTRKEILEAAAFLDKQVDEVELEPMSAWQQFGIVALFMLNGTLLVLVILPSVAATLALRSGPLLYLLGLAIVTRDGTPAGRILLIGRLVLIWLPVTIGLGMTSGISFTEAMSWKLAIPLAVYAAGFGILALWKRPGVERGIHDKLLGTWLVPR